MPAIGVASLLAMSEKPGGIVVTLSPWLIHTSSNAVPLWRYAVRNAGKQFSVPARAYFRIAELAHFTGFDLAAKLGRHRLHAVADAQHRYTPLSRLQRGARGVSPSVTLLGPPERMIPAGANSRTKASDTSKAWISQ